MTARDEVLAHLEAANKDLDHLRDHPSLTPPSVLGALKHLQAALRTIAISMPDAETVPSQN